MLYCKQQTDQTSMLIPLRLRRKGCLKNNKSKQHCGRTTTTKAARAEAGDSWHMWLTASWQTIFKGTESQFSAHEIEINYYDFACSVCLTNRYPDILLAHIAWNLGTWASKLPTPPTEALL